MKMPGRYGSESIYRYGFQGQEKDDELFSSEGTAINYKYRMHDPRIGRFMSVDPLAKKFAYNSTYAFSENVVINAIELEGLEKWYINDKEVTATPPKLQLWAATAIFYIRNTNAANRIGIFDDASTNISSNVGRVAKHVAKDGNMTKGEGTQRNAFRHALWSSVITEEFGETVALEATYAHEGVSPFDATYINTSEKFTGDKLLADNIVDILNNKIGRELGKMEGKQGVVELAKHVLDVQYTEGLFVANKNKDNTFTIVREKISKEQYEQGMKNLEDIDNNGRDEEDRNKYKKTNEDEQ